MPVLRAAIVALAVVCITGCATIAPHQFAEPMREWQTRSGQLLYRNAQTTLIGDLLVRFSEAGDFELIFSKGPGVTLLSIRQDASFAEAKGAMAGRGWAGPVERAPEQLRGWLALREKILCYPNRRSIRYSPAPETFLLRF